MVNNMSAKQSKYYNKVIDGYLCTFDSETHQCAGVMLCTGMDIQAWEDFNSKMLGSIDPDEQHE